MTFPDKKFDGAAEFTASYFSKMNAAAKSDSGETMQQASDILADAYSAGRMVYFCGNGGSAAIANHMVCDHCKLVQTDTTLTPRIVSLSSTAEILTAIGNDVSYDDVFKYQIQSLGKPGDVLITISSSGDSENIVRAAGWAKENGMKVICLTGFSGGRSAGIGDVNLHVTADNYGIIEDIHSSLLHILAQYIRQAEMSEELIQERKF